MTYNVGDIVTLCDYLPDALFVIVRTYPRERSVRIVRIEFMDEFARNQIVPEMYVSVCKLRHIPHNPQATHKVRRARILRVLNV